MKKWVPELSRLPGVYAMEDMILEGRKFNAAGDARKAMKFNSQKECQIWCDSQEYFFWEPRKVEL